MPRRSGFLLALLLLASSQVARGDRLAPKSGPALRGVVVSRSPTEVVFNPYWSRNPGMTWGVVRLPADRVKKVEVAPHAEVEVFRRLAARKDGDTEALVATARYAQEEKLKAHARLCWSLVLAESPEHAEALKAIGGRGKWKALQAGNVHLDAGLRELLTQYVAESEPATRKRLAPEIRKRGFKSRLETLERYRRSASEPRGLTEDRPLSWASDRYPGAVYTLFVPRGYDPVVPWPLIVGLHGGGPDGKLRDEVVGSGPSAMNFYRTLAGRHGFLVVCPTAREAPWGTPQNEGFLRAVLEEMKLRFNVDLDRIYLTGHSMGGFGTWALGPKMAEDLAAISPMAGAGRGGIGELVKTRTPIFIYHSDNDFISVEPDRTAANQLRESGLDFVYTELPGQGHGFPPSIRQELYAFFGPRRRYDKKRKHAWPRSSLHGKATKDEKRYLGDPLAAIEGEPVDLATCLGALRLGGGRGRWAATKLRDTSPEEATKAAVKVLKDRRVSADARACAAMALGTLGTADGFSALRKAVQLEPSREQSVVTVEAARALTALEDGDGAKSLSRAVEAWTQFFEGKVEGGQLYFSDWIRAVGTLAALVEAWGSIPSTSEPRGLDRSVVKRVLAPNYPVQTSERVPQDPSAPRVALAKAVARAYATWEAPEKLWTRLEEAVEPDARALEAVRAAR